MGLRQWATATTCLVFALTRPAAGADRFLWTRPGGLDASFVGLSKEGAVLLLDTEGATWWGPPPIPDRLPRRGSLPAGWQRRDVPAGFRDFGVAAMAGGTIFVTGRWGPHGRPTLLRIDTRRPGATWEDLEPPTLGNIYAVSALDPRRVWVSGEWRDVFRFNGTHWVREVTPAPLHNESMVINPDETGWIVASSRTRSALLYRDATGWRTVATHDDDAWARTGLRYADADEAVVQTDHGIERIAAPGRAARPMTVAFPGVDEAAIALSAAQDGFAIDEAGLVRIGSAGRESLAILNPARIVNLKDLGSAGLFGVDGASGSVVALHRAIGNPDPIRDEGGLRLIEARRPISSSARVHGLAVFRLHGLEYVYVVDHDGLNPTLPLASLGRAAGGDLVTAWRELSRRLGTMDVRRGTTLEQVYDSGALAADLDGDGDEDIILVSMYDGIREYRNERDDHFVDWSSEAGIAVDRMDLPSGACLLDADGDGDLDLYVANGLSSDRLHLNDGSGGFRDVTEPAGIHTRDGGAMPACMDLDGDGDIDVVVATSARGLLIQENIGTVQGVPQFREHRLLLDRADLDGGPGLSTLNISSLALADLDGDGLPEIFAAVTNGQDRLFRNEGKLQFRETGELVHERAPTGGSVGAEWVDLDGDGALDLVVTGTKGNRILMNRHGTLQESDAVDPTTHPTAVGVTRAIVTADLDDDGDLDVVVGTDGKGIQVFENVNNRPSPLVLRLVGPPGNRDAVGASIEVRRVDDGRVVARKEVPGSSGSGSNSSKQIHVTGIASDVEYEIAVRLPGHPMLAAARVRAPFHGDVGIGSTGIRAGLERARWRAAHFFANPWNRRWVAGSILVFGVIGLFGAVLHRGTRPAPMGWVAIAGMPLLAFVLLTILPLDSGLPATATSVAVSGLVAGALLAVSRSRLRAAPVPTLLADLGLALRAFEHNEMPRRTLENLKFELQDLRRRSSALQGSQAEFLVEDLHSYRGVVLPQLVAISRLATSAGWDGSGLRAEIRRQVPGTARLLRLLGDSTASLPADPRAGEKLVRSLDRTLGWIAEARNAVDQRLALDLHASLSRYVTLRRTMVASGIELRSVERETQQVRFLEAELHTVFDVLLENAVHAQQRDPSKSVLVVIEPPFGRRLPVTVRDEGPGVAEALKPRLFGYGESGTPGGHGFGLHDAQRTMQRFGGTIALDESGGPGACFRLEFELIAPDRRGGPAEVA